MEIQEIRPEMTSLQLAKAVGKRHADVLRDLRKMGEAWEKVQGRNFAFTHIVRQLPNGGHKKEVMYQLGKPEILFIVSKYDDELRAKIIIRLYELEEQNRRMMQAQLDKLWDKQDQEDLYPKWK